MFQCLDCLENHARQWDGILVPKYLQVVHDEDRTRTTEMARVSTDELRIVEIRKDTKRYHP